MTKSRRLKTARFDIYKNLVTRTARKEGEEINDDTNYPFDTNYQLFAAGLTLGFLNNEQREESKGNYSGNFIDVNRVGGASDNEYRQGIELIYQLLQMEYPDKDDTEVWEQALQYADWGVEHLDGDMDIKDDFDLLGFIDEAEGLWQERLEEVIDYPQEANA